MQVHARNVRTVGLGVLQNSRRFDALPKAPPAMPDTAKILNEVKKNFAETVDFSLLYIL